MEREFGDKRSEIVHDDETVSVLTKAKDFLHSFNRRQRELSEPTNQRSAEALTQKPLMILASAFRSSPDYDRALAEINDISWQGKRGEGPIIITGHAAHHEPITKESDPKLYKYYVAWLKKNGYEEYISS